eukprot:scaffold9214_cov125-Skeletonema_dohrnii-CCMP3373.AAC.3
MKRRLEHKCTRDTVITMKKCSNTCLVSGGLQDVHAKLKLGEYALRMEQRGDYVRLKDVQMESLTEECA